MMLRLKSALAAARISQRELAAAVRISRPALNTLVNHGHWPSDIDRRTVRRRIAAYVRRRGGNARGLFEEAPDDAPQPEIPAPEDPDMLLRKQSLTSQARRHFNLPRDPFGDPTAADDVFLSAELRYVREAMYQTARHGGFMAVIGESGAGKTVLREELIGRLRREEQAVIVIEPYVLAMEASDRGGKTLRSQHIAEAIMACAAPLAQIKSSPEARFRQLHQALIDSARAGHSHVLMIEEAHSLPLPTLKHLKRFRELKDGLRPLLSVILIGQPELGVKLSEHNPELREVVQRVEIVTLPPLDGDLEAYLAHRFRRAGIGVDDVLAKGATEALRTKLTPTRAQGTLLYPLAVHNALAASMNHAARLGIAQITADVILGV